MAYLTEPEAWEKIARAFYKNEEVFLCVCVDSLYMKDLISAQLHSKIETIIMEDVKLFNGNHNHFASGKLGGKKWCILRADYCVLQSIIAKEGESK